MKNLITNIGLKIDAKEAKQGADEGVDQLERVNKAAQGVKKRLKQLFVGVSVGAAVSEFSTYNQELTNVASVSGAAADEFKRMNEEAKSLALLSRFDPAQVASGMYSLASAGQSVNEQLNTLPNVLDLAEAAQADLASTTELTVSTMAQFNIEASDSQRVVDVFTASIANSATNVGRLQVAMANSGSTAAALNQDFESSVAIVSLLTTAFGNGEKAGTGYKSLLAQLAQNGEKLGVTISDSSGKMRPLVDILDDIRATGLPTLDLIKAVGQEAGPSLAILLNQGREGILGMRDALESTGQASQTAAGQLDTLQGDIDQLRSAVSVLFIEFGEGSEGILRPAIQALTTGVKFLAENLQTLLKVIVVVASARGVGLLASGLLNVGRAFLAGQGQIAGYTVKLSLMQKVAITARGALTGLFSLLGGAVGVVTAVATSFFLFRDSTKDAKKSTEELIESTKSLLSVMNESATAPYRAAMLETRDKIFELERQLKVTTEALMQYGHTEESAAERTEGLRSNIQVLKEQLEDLKTKTKEVIATEKEQASAVADVVNVVGQTSDKYTEWVEAMEKKIAATQLEIIEIERGKNAVLEYNAEQAKSLAQTEEEKNKIDQLTGVLIGLNNEKQKATRLQNETNQAMQFYDQLLVKIKGRGNPFAQAEADRNNARAKLASLLKSGDLDFDEYIEGMKEVSATFNEETESILESIEKLDLSKMFDGFANGLNPVISGLSAFRGELAAIDEMAKSPDFSAGEAAFYKTGLSAEFALNSMASMAQEGSDAQKKLAAAAAITNTILGIKAILTQGEGDPYTAFGRMAAMAALVASLGVQVSGAFGGSGGGGAERQQEIQGTGTVLGDSEAKSESISNSLDIIADASEKIVGINSRMLRSLDRMNDAIAGTANQIAKIGNIGELGTRASGAFGLTGAIDKLIFGGSKVTDRGVQILAGGISDAIDGTLFQAYEVAKRRGLFGSRRRTNTADLDQGISDQIGLIFESMRDTILSGAEALGLNMDQVQRALDAYRIEEQRISLMDLDADEQRAELEAVFSSIFDGLTAFSIPFIAQFQEAGEGLGETLTRVATNVLVFEEAIGSMGLQFIEKQVNPELFAQAAVAIAEFSGGLEEFIDGYSSYVSKFLSESEQFDIVSSRIGGVFGDLELSLPGTREGFTQLIQGLDLTTASGQEAFGTLIALSDEIDAFYTGMEKMWGSVFDAFYTEQENAARELLDLNASDSSIQAELGTDLTFDTFREAFEDALPTLSAADLSKWLQLGQSLAAANALAEDLAEGSLLSALENYQSLADELSESNVSLNEQLMANYSSVHDLINAYDGSISAEREIAAGLNDRYEMELAFIEQIRSASLSIDEMLNNSIENIRLSLLSDEEKYEFLSTRAEELAEGLSSLTDPEQIRAAINEINDLQNQAYGLLDEGQREQMAEGFITFLEEVNELAQARLSGLEADAASQTQSLTERIASLMETQQQNEINNQQQFAQTVANMAATVQNMAAAVARMEQMTFDVNVNLNGGVYDVGGF